METPSQSPVQPPPLPPTPQRRQILTMPLAVVIAGALISGSIIAVGWHSQGGSATAGTPQPALAVDATKVKTDGDPIIGKPDAPVTIAYWFDYQCPFCKMAEENVMPQLVKDYVDTGKVRIVFKDFAFLGPDSQTLGQFARAVWEVAPDKFYDWHKAVFDAQGTENTGWATSDKIHSITLSVLGASDTNKVAELVIKNTALYQKEMDADRAEGASYGVTGTPGFIIDKVAISGAQPYAAFKAAIDGTLAKK